MRSTERLPDDIHAELVGSVFATIVPTAIMTLLYMGVAAMAVRASADPLLHTLAALGLAAAAVRLGSTLWMRRRLRATGQAIADRPRAAVEAIERRFALPYVAFAAALGAFSARALHVLPVGEAMLVAPLIVGYCAGVATGVGLRPLICLPSMAMAVLPAVSVAAAMPGASAHMLAVLLAGLLAGGVRSVLLRHRAAVDDIALRLLFASMARHDHLTGLPNRLALAERFDRATAEAGRLAVHCIDLDGFKPINDRHGHPVGDAVLKAVSSRLAGLLGARDFAARLGGDEFMLVQRDADEAAVRAMSARILDAIVGGYVIDGVAVRVGACVGLAWLREGERFEAAVARADASLLEAKRARRRGGPPRVAVGARL